MSYGLRNTIILLITLFLILGMGFIYSEFILDRKLNNLKNSITLKRNDLNSKQNINIQFNELNERYKAALEVIRNYDKIFYSLPINPMMYMIFLTELMQQAVMKLTLITLTLILHPISTMELLILQ